MSAQQKQQQDITAILGRAAAGDECARRDRLAEWNARLARETTLRYFGQLTISEVAAALAISTATVEKDWRLARAWLRGQLRGEDE
jgi:DNA-directed RNA polymerase specialized sigma24 family protein